MTGPYTAQLCDICGDPGGVPDTPEELGEIDCSINDDRIVHMKCWRRDPEAHSWVPLQPKEEHADA